MCSACACASAFFFFFWFRGQGISARNTHKKHHTTPHHTTQQQHTTKHAHTPHTHQRKGHPEQAAVLVAAVLVLVIVLVFGPVISLVVKRAEHRAEVERCGLEMASRVAPPLRYVTAVTSALIARAQASLNVGLAWKPVASSAATASSVR